MEVVLVAPRALERRRRDAMNLRRLAYSLGTLIAVAIAVGASWKWS